MQVSEFAAGSMDYTGGAVDRSVCRCEMVCAGWSFDVRCYRLMRERLESLSEQCQPISRPVPALGDVLAVTSDTSDTRRLEGRPVVEMDELKEPDRDDG